MFPVLQGKLVGTWKNVSSLFPSEAWAVSGLDSNIPMDCSLVGFMINMPLIQPLYETSMLLDIRAFPGKREDLPREPAALRTTGRRGT